MANLKALIRLRSRTVDEKQKILGALYADVNRLEMQMQSLVDLMARERQIAEDMGVPEAISTYNRFAEGIRRKIEIIEKNKQKLEVRIDIARNDLREAFAELKKVEITQASREAQERAVQARKEALAMDDIALNNYRRRVAEDEEE